MEKPEDSLHERVQFSDELDLTALASFPIFLLLVYIFPISDYVCEHCQIQLLKRGSDSARDLMVQITGGR